MKNKFLFLTIAFIIYAISAQAQVKPKPQVKTVNKQKIVAKSGTSIKGTFKDTRDGKIYKTVKIGAQIWMAENLAYCIPIKLTTLSPVPAICSYNNDENYARIYGYLYTWEAAKTACPTGWHLPSDAEWTELTTYLGGEDFAGTKMKSTSGWNAQNEQIGNGDNTSGFSGLPGGYRGGDGAFNGIGNYGDWWSSTEGSKEDAWNRGLNYSNSMVYRSYFFNKQFGFSVRCLSNL